MLESSLSSLKGTSFEVPAKEGPGASDVDDDFPASPVQYEFCKNNEIAFSLLDC